MNREQLEKTITDLAIKSKAGQEISNLTDFILDNFDPKQETERVTAKEVFLACLTGHIANPDDDIDWPIDKMTKYAAEVAEKYNNHKNLKL